MKTITIDGVEYDLVPKEKSEQYPIFKRNEDGEVFRFESERKWECVLTKHNDYYGKQLYSKAYSEFETIPYDKEKGLYHLQPVWFKLYDCKGTIDIPEIGFYDAESNNVIYSITGCVCHYNEIEPITPEQLKVMPFIWSMYQEVLKDK